MLSITLIGEQRVMAELDAVPDVVMTALRRKMRELTIRLQTRVRDEKLSGQVLNVVTGALRRSILTEVREEENTVIGEVYSAADVKYAAIHEFGFDGEETVKQHMRTVVFGRTVDPFSVGPYTRNMKMPERSFLRSSLDEMAGDIQMELKESITEALAAGAAE